MKKLILITSLLLICPTLVFADITTGLVGWWKFDEGTGTTVNDSSGSGFNGTTTNGTYTTASKIGPYAMNYASGYSEVTGNIFPSQSPSGSKFTQSVWVYVSSYQNAREQLQIVPSIGNGSFGADVYINSSNQLTIEASTANVTNVTFSQSTAIPLNTWTLVTGVWSGSSHSGGFSNDAELFVNGVDIGGVNYGTGSTSNNTTDWIIGALKFVGSIGTQTTVIIDDLRFYNRALTSGDIAQLYTYRNPLIYIGNAMLNGNFRVGI